MGAHKDYTDKKIGRLHFISHFKQDKKLYWNIECECGNNFAYRSDYISNMKCTGRKFECNKCKMKRRSSIEINSKYGRLTVVRQIPGKDHHSWYQCLCECGNYTDVPGVRLNHKSKPTRSCGCLSRKLHSKWANTTQFPPAHGFKKNSNIKTLKKKIYSMRCRIVAICYRKENTEYKNYGGIGCTVCDLWRNGAKDFVNWCLENDYKSGKCIVLKKGKKEFNPNNCKIVSKNKHLGMMNSKFIQYNDKSKSISDWAQELGCSISCLSLRLRKYTKKYGIEKVMDLSWIPERTRMYGTEKYEKDIVELYIQGNTYLEISQQLGCSSSTIKRFLKNNSVAIRPAKRRSALT